MKSSSTKTQNERLWRTHYKAWSTSGQSQRAYCKQEGISYRSFVYQHSRLISQSKKALNFIEAKPASGVINNQSTGLHLILPNGIRIGIGAEINPVILQTVLNVAGAIPCLS